MTGQKWAKKPPGDNGESIFRRRSRLQSPHHCPPDPPGFYGGRWKGLFSDLTGAPRPRKVRYVPFPADAENCTSLPCSSSPNRTRCAGLRLGTHNTAQPPYARRPWSRPDRLAAPTSRAPKFFFPCHAVVNGWRTMCAPTRHRPLPGSGGAGREKHEPTTARVRQHAGEKCVRPGPPDGKKSRQQAASHHPGKSLETAGF